MFRALLQSRTQDEEQVFLSRTLESILWTIMGAVLLISAGVFLLPEFKWRWLLQIAVVYFICIPVFGLNRSGHVRLASILFIAGLWAFLTVSALTGGGIATLAAVNFLIIIFSAGLLLGSRAGFATALICILTNLVLVVIEITGHMPGRLIPYTPTTRWVNLTVLIIVVMTLQHLGARNTQKALERSRRELQERQWAEEELDTSERRFSKAFSLGPHRMGIIRIRDGVVLDVNDRWAQETGFGRQEIIGHSILEMASFMDLEERAGMRRLLEAGKPFRDIEVRIFRKTGEERVVLSSGEVIELGDERCLLFSANDITERKQAEERIALLQMITLDVSAAEDLPAALEVVLRRVCEMTGWALGQAWVPNLNGTLNCCPAWFVPAATVAAPELQEFRTRTKDFSFRPGEGLPGRVWESKQSVWDRDVTLEPNFPRVEFAKKAGLKAGLGIPIRCGDEVIAVLEFFLREKRDEDERLVEVISAVAAQIGLVVGRKRTEDALRESERRFSDMLTNVQMIAVMADANGDLLFCNDYLLQLTGWKRDEALGHNWYEMFLPEKEQERVSAILGEAPPAGEIAVHFENEIKTRSGQQRLVRWTNTALRNSDGQIIGLAALGDDITERKLAETVLRTSKEQLRALSAKVRSAREEEGARIAREIHDELGSALTGLKWDLEAMDKSLSKSENGLPATAMRNRIGAMTTLIESTINTVRRISSDLRPGVLDDLGLVAAIEWQVHQFRSRATMNCHWQTTLDSVHLNRESSTAVFRIFQEILTNVLRHSQAANVYVELRLRGSYLDLKVRDDGRGITESERANAKSLGLLGMRERALLVGGEVQVDGERGKGTTVLVSVPVEG